MNLYLSVSSADRRKIMMEKDPMVDWFTGHVYLGFATNAEAFRMKEKQYGERHYI